MFSAALLATLLASPPPACPTELFRIARNKNANVVVYEIDAARGARDPVRATWLMLAEDGRREDLNAFERTAYGLEVRRTEPGLSIVLKADRSREIEIREHAGCPRAFGIISGREALLERIYIDAEERVFLPSVRFVDVFGTDPLTGARVHERVFRRSR